MKLFALIVCLSLLSVAVLARDLSALAKKERARRAAVQKSSGAATTFTNEELKAYRQQSMRSRATPRGAAPSRPDRDFKKEEAFWRKETARHDRELARFDANIRRLEWRLRERELKSHAKGRLIEDPSLRLMEESLESLREERERLDAEFRERARKAGAFPGWLR